MQIISDRSISTILSALSAMERQEANYSDLVSLIQSAREEMQAYSRDAVKVPA